jgi:Ca-activated chloride channel family protein
VLARRSIKIVAADVTVSAPAEVIAGSAITVTWTGPNNAGDYITIVAKAARDGEHGNSTYTTKGSPLTVPALIESGDAELRYMTVQSTRVLARRPIKITAADVTLSAPGEAVAGTAVTVRWTGPNNPGDYITLVTAASRDGEHGNNNYTTKGSPVTVTAPIDAGDVEVRYMSGQGAKVLARRPIKIAAAIVTLTAPDQIAAGSPATITWTGPNNPGDYLTIVAKSARDGEHGASTYATTGSPLTVLAPKIAGDAEVRYMSGQGARVLMRRPITITAGK